jgi:hypothetical protein
LQPVNNLAQGNLYSPKDAIKVIFYALLFNTILCLSRQDINLGLFKLVGYLQFGILPSFVRDKILSLRTPSCILLQPEGRFQLLFCHCCLSSFESLYL